ncbi:MAG: hypothetical protein KDA61_11880 [Planctomycetales bacterium]|nr:hypothetical protein [Planctomycetales bacterium]
MDPFNVIIVTVSSYLAIISLVRLMAARRNELIDDVRDQLQRGQSLPRSAALDGDGDGKP